MLTESQRDVLNVIRKLGPLPDHALVPIVQHVATAHWSSSGIRTRRRELERVGLIEQAGAVPTSSGRAAALFRVKP